MYDHVGVEARVSNIILDHSLPCFEAGSLIELETHYCTGIRDFPLPKCLAFYMVVRDLSSGPHACRAKRPYPLSHHPISLELCLKMEIDGYVSLFLLSVAAAALSICVCVRERDRETD